MRIKIKLSTPEETGIDLNYNYYLSSVVYELLRKSNTQYSARLHESGYILGGRKFKLFTFSSLFPRKYSVDGSTLYIKEGAEFYIASPMSEFVLHLADGLLSAREVRICNSKFYIETVEVLPQPAFKRETRFICLSPFTSMTVEEVEGEKKAVPCVPGSFKFAENIKNNLLRKYHLINGKLPDDLSFEISFKQSDLEKYGKGKLIKFKETFVKAYLIPFTIKGSIELMKVGYECGIGEKNSAGFGMVERG